MRTIYETLKQRFTTDDESKKAKYARKMNVVEQSFTELTKEPLKTFFNYKDYLKTAFLQYMIYAYNAEAQGVILLPIC